MLVEERGGTVEQCLFYSGTVEQWNSDSGAGWWISGTVLVEQWNSVGGTVIVEQFRGIVKPVERCGGTVEQLKCNSVVEQCWWNSRKVKVEHCGGTVEQ